MSNSLVVMKNHFGGNDTFVFQMGGEKFVSNGCQFFSESDKEKVYSDFKVGCDFQNDVDHYLSTVTTDLTKEEVMYLVSNYSKESHPRSIRMLTKTITAAYSDSALDTLVASIVAKQRVKQKEQCPVNAPTNDDVNPYKQVVMI